MRRWINSILCEKYQNYFRAREKKCNKTSVTKKRRETTFAIFYKEKLLCLDAHRSYTSRGVL